MWWFGSKGVRNFHQSKRLTVRNGEIIVISSYIDLAEWIRQQKQLVDLLLALFKYKISIGTMGHLS